MTKKVTKFSKLSPVMRKLVREKIDYEDVSFFSFPYQGGTERGFLIDSIEEGGLQYLIIMDDAKPSSHREDEEEEDDDYNDEETMEVADEEE